MNSVLQCLSNIPPLTEFFLSGRWESTLKRSSPTKGELAAGYAELVTRMWQSSSGRDNVERPLRIKQVIGQVASRFLGYDQHDAQEFLRFFLDALHDDTNRAPKLPYKELNETPSQSDIEVSEDWWRYYSERNDSECKRLFSGQLKTMVTCSACGHVSRAFDPFWDLALPIPKGRSTSSDGPASCTISECLSEFIAEEKMGGNDSTYCSRCKKHQACTKKMDLFRLPDVLVLHIKRFCFSSFRRTKLTTSVDLPRYGFDMQPFCSPTVPRELRGDTTYELVAISNHSGSLGGGHYTADCRNRDNWDWYNFNDSRVSSTSNLSGSAAYLLFFVRRRVLLA
jgi:ubiquitin C-terminal hydrolase